MSPAAGADASSGVWPSATTELSVSDKLYPSMWKHRTICLSAGCQERYFPADERDGRQSRKADLSPAV
ncbi:hypothetical protein CEXT_125491, partial [Caerostris extrusa]